MPRINARRRVQPYEITEEDLQICADHGLTRHGTAKLMGFPHSSVCKAARRFGVKFPDMRVKEARVVRKWSGAQAMPFSALTVSI